MELSRLPHRNQFSDERVPDDLFVTAIREAPRPSSEIARQLDAVCLNIRANAALTRGEHSTAKQDALSAIEICPEFAGPHWCLSCASEAIGDIRQAYVSIVDAINCCEAGFRRGNSNWDLANFPFIGEQLRGLCQRHASALNIMVELEHAFIKEPRSATLNALLSKILAARADVSGTKNSVE
jgi:hypothetical protein